MGSDYPTDNLTLEEVHEDQLAEVVDAMKQYLPHSIHVQSSVSVTKHYGLAAVLDRKVFTPRHPEYRHKIVVVKPVTTKKELQSLQVFWSCSELNEDAVYCLLKTLPGFCWCKPFLVRLLPEHLHQQLSRVVSRLSCGSVFPLESTPLLVHLFESPVPELSSPGPEYVIGRIRRPDYDRVLANMVLSKYEDPTTMETVFDSLPCIGIYKGPDIHEKPQKTGGFIQERLDNPLPKTEAAPDAEEGKHGQGSPDDPIPKTDAALSAKGDKNGQGRLSDHFAETDASSEADGTRYDAEDEEYQGMKLVSWCTVKPGGDVGTTFTEKEHRGKKLARTAMFAAMKYIEGLGTYPYSNCEEDNEASRNMLQRMGFQNKFVARVTLYSEQGDD